MSLQRKKSSQNPTPEDLETGQRPSAPNRGFLLIKKCRIFIQNNSMLFYKRNMMPTPCGWMVIILGAMIILRWLYGMGTETPQMDTDVRVANAPHLPQVPQVDDRDLNPKLAKVEEFNRQDRYIQLLKERAKKNPLQIPDFDPNTMGEKKVIESHQVRPQPKVFPVPLVNEPELGSCSEKPLIILIVRSLPGGTGERQAIRSSWGNQENSVATYKGLKWKTIFVLGKSETQFDNLVTEEADKFHDILRGDFPDSEFEDTRKFMMATTWLINNAGSCLPKYILKTQDNIYHNMHSIIGWLEAKFGNKTEDLYLGKLLRGDQPIRIESDPRYVSKGDFPNDVFPTLIEGPVYLFSIDVFMKMAKVIEDHWVTPIPMEDAYVGILADYLKVPPRHNDHFQMIGKTTNICHHLKMFFIFGIYPSEHETILRKMKAAEHDPECQGVEL